MRSLLQNLPIEVKRDLSKEVSPTWISPMLATLTHDRFSKEGWIFERKFDGERCLIYKKSSEVRLLSRNQKVLNNNYPEIAEAMVKHCKSDLVVDGEIVAFEGNVTSFALLQGRMQVRDPEKARHSGIKIYYYIFDLLNLDGYNIRKLELLDRKKLLRHALDFKDPLRFTVHREREGEAYYQEACRKGWEGVIAKRAAGKYVGKRSRDWLKFKCVNQQELVIGGYTEPAGNRIGFGSLLIGYFEEDKLLYAGKVGTGYNEETLRNLRGKLEEIERDGSPFKENIAEKNIHWVKPMMVAEIGFTEWTRQGKLRHPRFLGLRRDKKPEEVHREG